MLLSRILELLPHNRQNHKNRANVAKECFEEVLAVLHFIEEVFFGVKAVGEDHFGFLSINFDGKVKASLVVEDVNEA